MSDDESVFIDPEQTSLFGDELAAWFPEWQGMPEFEQKNLEPWKSVIVHFASSADMAAFAALVEQRITPNTQSLWYPEAEIGRYADKRYVSES